MLKTDSLDPDSISAGLRTKHIGRKVLVYNSTSSTNDVTAEYAKNPSNDGLAVFAEEQTAGRGRTGSRWIAAAGDSILCSVLLTECGLSADLLSLTCAVAIAETIGQPARIKWPNDILIGGRKVAGILLEAKPVPHGTAHIIGIGINCHQAETSFPPELQKIATSIDIENGSRCDRISLSRRLLASIDNWLDIASYDGDKVICRWKQLSIQLGHRVTLTYNGRRFTGHCIGLDPQNGLILRLDTGGVRIFSATHASIVR